MSIIDMLPTCGLVSGFSAEAKVPIVITVRARGAREGCRLLGWLVATASVFTLATICMLLAFDSGWSWIRRSACGFEQPYACTVCKIGRVTVFTTGMPPAFSLLAQLVFAQMEEESFLDFSNRISFVNFLHCRDARAVCKDSLGLVHHVPPIVLSHDLEQWSTSFRDISATEYANALTCVVNSSVVDAALVHAVTKFRRSHRPRVVRGFFLLQR